MKSKKISKEEAALLHSFPIGKGHWLRKELRKLEVGEIFFVVASEWKWKRCGPNELARRLQHEEGSKFEVLRVADRSGWLIERIS